MVLESQSRLHKRNLRRRGPENSDTKSTKRKQLTDILFIFICTNKIIYLHLCVFIYVYVYISLTFFFLLRPALIFRLKDEDIHSDMQAMKSVTKQKRKRESKTFNINLFLLFFRDYLRLH